MKRYKFFSVLFIFLLGFSLFVPQTSAAEKSFTDYHQDNFGYEAVSNLLSQGIIQGYEDSSFKPNRPVNRIETAIIFKRALGLEATNGGSGFKDVPATSEFANVTAAVKEAGIFKGSSNGNFGPKDLLTREQMASVLVRAFDLKPISTVSVELNDLDQVSSAHANDVKILYQNQITNGKAEGLFDPKGLVTRAEFSVFSNRVLSGEVAPQPEPVPAPAPAPAPGTGSVPAPGGGGGSAPKPEPLTINSISLTTAAGKIEGIESNGIITFDISDVTNNEDIYSGSMSVSADSTLVVTNSMGEFGQELTKGSNNLSFVSMIKSLSSFGYNLNEMRQTRDSFDINGTLVNKNNSSNSKNITFRFLLK